MINLISFVTLQMSSYREKNYIHEILHVLKLKEASY